MGRDKENEKKDDMKLTLPHRVELKEPYEIGDDRKITSIEFKYRLTAEHCLHLGGAWDIPSWKNEEYLPMMAGMCGEPTVLFKKMSPGDFRTCQEVILNFL